jgi:hypothetical protein
MENNIEQMKQDVRTYIALGMNWVDYHRQIMKNKNEKKTEKLTKDMNEYIFRALDHIDYFEETISEDVFEAIAELDEEEKQFVIYAKELRATINQNNILPKGFDTSVRYVRNDIERIKKAREQLNLSDNEDIQKTNTYIEERYINLGRLITTYSLQPYLDQFTLEEQQYINDGRMAKLKSEYAQGAEKARKFLATSAKFKKVGNSISQVGVDFNKGMTEKGEEMGDKVREAGVKLSPLIIDVGEAVIELTDKLQEINDAVFDKLEDANDAVFDKLEDANDAVFDKLQDANDTVFNRLQNKLDDVFAKKGWKEIKEHIKKECLKIVPNAPNKAIEITAKEVYFESRNYMINEYPALKEKEDKLREEYINKHGSVTNEDEFEKYLSVQIPYYDKYRKFRNNYDDFYEIFVKHDYDYVNS